MQILEASMVGLRTARMVFRSRKSTASVTLYPMVHVGEQRFYDEVYAEAFAYDVVLVEGVRSPIGRHIARSYRWLNAAKLGLIFQPKTPGQDSVKARIVNADLSTEEFHREWKRIPFWLKALTFVGVLVVGLRRRLIRSRENLAKNLSLEDHRSPDEILAWTPRLDPLHHAILHARDSRLIECLAAELDGPDIGEKRIAVVYGAAHMRRVLDELARRGFHSVSAEWRTIISP